MLGLGLIYRFYPSIDATFNMNDQIAKKSRILEEFEEAVREKKGYEARLKVLTRNLIQAESAFFKSATADLAAVDIQNLLNDISRQSGIDIYSRRSLAVVKPDNLSPLEKRYATIPVQITITCSVRQLKEIMYRIENAPKLLEISAIQIRRTGKTDEKIRTTLTVSGIMNSQETN